MRNLPLKCFINYIFGFLPVQENLFFCHNRTIYSCIGTPEFISGCDSIYMILVSRMSTKEIPEHQKNRIEVIGMFLKNWRLNEGLTQREFSELSGIHYNSTHNIEHYKLYSVLTLLKSVDATGLTLGEFFEGME